MELKIISEGLLDRKNSPRFSASNFLPGLLLSAEEIVCPRDKCFLFVALQLARRWAKSCESRSFPRSSCVRLQTAVLRVRHNQHSSEMQLLHDPNKIRTRNAQHMLLRETQHSLRKRPIHSKQTTPSTQRQAHQQARIKPSS